MEKRPTKTKYMKQTGNQLKDPKASKRAVFPNN